MSDHVLPAPPPPAVQLFGDALPRVTAYAEMLAADGVVRGLMGPREVPRLWERHLLNCAVIAERIGPGLAVVDVGSGAGLPGIVLAIARPDLRGRAEEPATVSEVAGADVVTARAVAPLDRLAGWCLPLVRDGGRLLAVKGESAAAEVAQSRSLIERSGGGDITVVRCGVGVIDPPTTVVEVVRRARVATKGRMR